MIEDLMLCAEMLLQLLSANELKVSSYRLIYCVGSLSWDCSWCMDYV